MSLFNDAELRDIIRDEIRAALRDEVRKTPANAGEYLSVAKAAEIASIAPQTIRRWIGEGRLAGYNAGRVIRVRRSELESFLVSANRHDGRSEPSPESLAERDFHRLGLDKKRDAIHPGGRR